MSKVLKIFYCSIIFCLPFEEIDMGTLGGLVNSATAPQILIMLSMPFMALSIIRSLLLLKSSKKRITFLKHIKIPVYCLAFFFLFEVISTISLSEGNVTVIEIMRTRVTSFALFVLPLFVLNKNTKYMNIYFLFIFSSVIIAASSIAIGMDLIDLNFGRKQVLKRIGSDVFKYRNTGLLNNFGDISILFSISIVSIVSVLTNFQKEVSILRKSLLLCSLIMLIISGLAVQSRNLLFSVVLAISIYFITNYTVKVDLKKAVLLSFMSLIMFLFILLFSDKIFSLFSSIYQVRGYTIDLRIWMLADGLETIVKSSLLGVGPGNYRFLGNLMHNMFLISILRAGVGGLFFICCIIYLYIGYFRVIRYAHGRIWFASFSSFMFAGMFYPAISQASAIIWLVLGTNCAVLNMLLNSVQKDDLSLISERNNALKIRCQYE